MHGFSLNRTTIVRVACAAAATALAALAAAQPPAPLAAPVEPSPEKQRMIELGIEHGTAWNLYQHFKTEAGGGDTPSWDRIPDWTGLWTREASPFFWDPDQTEGTLPTAKLTPEYERRLREKLDRVARGIEYDPLSACNPAGMPRWLAEPFLREFVVTPQQTWLINEMMNEVRRVYTDGRGHPPPEDAYPLWEGDSIGFWDGDRLVIHTSQMREGQYQRIQPDYSEQVEVVEVWHKAADDTMIADVWVYDPPALVEPWYTRQVYKKLSNDDKSLRIRYWHCAENPNNVVIQTDEGTSDFADFTFTEADDLPAGEGREAE
ncbi:MAG TPA: hypothetical protein VF339_05420 [Gammaproteobacteria bacterium]